LIDRRLAEVLNRLMALCRAALTIALRFTTSDAQRTALITNYAHSLVNIIGQLLRDHLMVAPASDRPIAQRNRMMAQIRNMFIVYLYWTFLCRMCIELQIVQREGCQQV